MNNKDIHEALIPISKEFFDSYLILGVRIDTGQKILLGDLGTNEDVRNQIRPIHEHLRESWLDESTGDEERQLDGV
jgi:hypothetical protein